MKPKLLKGIGFFIFILLVINVILFALGKISPTIFWAVIVFGALFTYVILPRLKKL